MVGGRIGDFLAFPEFIKEALQKHEPLTDVEAKIRSGQRSINCVMSLRFVKNTRGLQWVIVTLRQEKDVRQLVQRQVGAQAFLTLEDIPGDSSAIKRVRRMVQTAAAAQASILIRGESGTGKNVLASAIHNESPRRDGPFLILACSSIPNELISRELLGYDEGLSNKRPGGRPGKFELAQGGTLFFQDVDALPLEAQGILLNVIELGIVQRLGSDRPIALDVRVIAATSANMERLVAQGSFRADLYYRLGAFEITIPALRERQKDLPLLVDKILKRLSQQVKRPIEVAPGVSDLLKNYAWPGNVRELEAILGRALIQAGASDVIGPLHLPKFIRNPINYSVMESGSLAVRSLNEIEREAILQSAQICRGNVTEMARILGVGRTTVWRKLKEFDIAVEDFRPKQSSIQI
jgi:transcriptional activator for dhaKLM operon